MSNIEIKSPYRQTLQELFRQSSHRKFKARHYQSHEIIECVGPGPWDDKIYICWNVSELNDEHAKLRKLDGTAFDWVFVTKYLD